MFWFGNTEYTVPFLRAGYHTQWAPFPEFEPSLNDQEKEEVLRNLQIRVEKEKEDYQGRIAEAEAKFKESLDEIFHINPEEIR